MPRVLPEVSTRSKGNRREDVTRLKFDSLGYSYCPFRGSGSTSEEMKKKLQHHVSGDGLAIWPGEAYMPWWQVSVGSHSIRSAFKELRENRLPGFKLMFIQYYYPRVKAKKKGEPRRKTLVAQSRVWLDEDTVFQTIEEALDATK